MNASWVGLGWLRIKQSIVRLKSSLALDDLVDSCLLVPWLVHGEDALTLVIIGLSYCLRGSEEIELLWSPIEDSQLLLSILCSIKVKVQLDFVCALDESGRLLFEFVWRYCCVTLSWTLLIYDYLVGIFNTCNSIPPLIGNQLGLSLDKQALLFLHFHLFELLTRFGDLTPPLARHLQAPVSRRCLYFLLIPWQAIRGFLGLQELNWVLQALFLVSKV